MQDTEPDFFGFQKIAESPDDWALDPDAMRQLGKLTWCVSEKIHGANFVCIHDGSQLRFAKRKALLQPDEEFFEHQRAMAPLEENFEQLFAQLRQEFGEELRQIFVYGELFGGEYPHPEVEAIEGLQAIQTGVYYCPDLRFCAFDLAVLLGDEARPLFLDIDEALDHLERAEIFATAILMEGTMHEALAFPIGFDSTIPARLGLPEIADNKAEGVVLKPTETLLIEDGKGGFFRPLLKRKIPEFSEDQRYHQATDWSRKPEPADTQKNYQLDLLEWEMLNRLNPNRVQAAVSKLGRATTDTAREQLRQLIVDDVWEEIERTHTEAMAGIDALEKTLLREILQDAVADLEL